MTSPEEAFAHAEEAVARCRAGGGYAETGPGALEGSIVSGDPTHDRLSEWAVIEIDAGDVLYSSRAGAPLTFLKRLVARLLRQYLVELEARQTRYNIALLTRLDRLEERVAAAERGTAGSRPPDAGG